jgi:small subunit ribosomal protein S7e
MGQEARRKPFEENTAAPDVILRDVMKKEKQPPTALESLLAETLFKMSADDSTKMLKYLHVMSVREVTVAETGERALVVFVPYTEMVSYRKMCPALTEALEDQLKAHVFLVAHRRILRKERRGKALYKQKRPMSRTISKVHEGYLEDIIWPGDVVAEKTVSCLCTRRVYIKGEIKATGPWRCPLAHFAQRRSVFFLSSCCICTSPASKPQTLNTQT